MAETVTAAQLEWALNRLALAIVKAGPDGAGYLPIYERFESELAAASNREAMMERALERVSVMKARNGDIVIPEFPGS